MAPWHLMFGVGLGLIATIIVTMISQRAQRAITCRPKTSFVSPPDDVCPICFGSMSNDERSYLNCGHALHQECLRNLRRHHDTCPTCRIQM